MGITTGAGISGGGTGVGVTTVGTYDSQVPSANGLVISGTVLWAQSASISVPGMVNFGSQTFAGSKTFSVTTTTGQTIATATPLTASLISVASSTITNAIGFNSSFQNLGTCVLSEGYRASDPTGNQPTTTIGFRGLVSSGTDKWNIYADGTATNYLKGNTSIGDSNGTTLAKLQVNYTTTRGDTLLQDRAAYNYLDTTLTAANTSGSSIIRGMENTSYLHTSTFNYNGLVIGEYCAAAVDGSGTLTKSVIGLEGQAFGLGTTVIAALHGLLGYNGVGAGCTVTDCAAVTAVGVQYSGTITNNYGFRVLVTGKSGSGVITNNYGLHIPADDTAGTTLNYPIYAAGTSPSYLEGPLQTNTNLQILSNANPTPTTGKAIIGAKNTVAESKRTLSLALEQVVDAGVGIVSTNKIKVVINGVEYYIPLTAV